MNDSANRFTDVGMVRSAITYGGKAKLTWRLKALFLAIDLSAFVVVFYLCAVGMKAMAALAK
jgi:hypothetical protein